MQVRCSLSRTYSCRFACARDLFISLRRTHPIIDLSAGILDNSKGAFDFHAVQRIKSGDEITWDYGAAEFHSICFQNCLCGSARCRGSRINFEDSFEAVRAQYGRYYASYLHSWSPPEERVVQRFLSDEDEITSANLKGINSS